MARNQARVGRDFDRCCSGDQKNALVLTTLSRNNLPDDLSMIVIQPRN
jgi:hypothetical protein